MAGAPLDIANRVVRGAAAVVVLAARRAVDGATAPGKAVVSEPVYAAAGGARGARVEVVAGGWDHRGRRRRRGGLGRGRAGLGGVLALLDGVRGLHGDPALACSCVHVALHPDVPGLAPARSPRVAHDPVVLPLLRSVAHGYHTVVEVGPA